ncbi:hypothetical protein O1611_g5107 [Lasiodiplodia mahajangana]|uniref:Uncharacterized protein n=1 Tax=Lasiodiplodia mahajangana TaxID=1108764 RepID=A0ACC2JMV6_9PEZI|nr:hypothetical protein O1611_g5107 [Lasiodiplodia mahajangana]
MPSTVTLRRIEKAVTASAPTTVIKNYPVGPSFQDWAFPHQKAIKWSRPKNTDAHMFDPRCIITQTAGLVDKAYLIPAADENWFKVNAMFRYGNHGDVHQKHNTITLRHDLQSAFDSHLFAIVPKRNHYVVHHFHASEASTVEFALTYHNRIIVQGSGAIAPEFLFACFSRAVLMLVKPFIDQSPIHRFVARLHRIDEDGFGRQKYLMETEWLSPQQLIDQYGGGLTNSSSPTKRKRNGEKSLDRQ